MKALYGMAGVGRKQFSTVIHLEKLGKANHYRLECAEKYASHT